MYCMVCGKPTNNSNGYCDECLNETNDIFIDENLENKNQEPLFKDFDEPQIMEESNEEKVERQEINLNKYDDTNVNYRNDDQVIQSSVRQENNYNNQGYNNQGYNNFQNQENVRCKYCVACGSQLHFMAKQCPKCSTEAGPLDEENGLVFGAIGCCVPVVGWILYFIWRDTKPKTAKNAMIGAILNVVLIILLYGILIFGVMATILGEGYYY
ncbi:MAG: hypothetical protein ACRDCW_13565 [Sarcina sp.]